MPHEIIMFNDPLWINNQVKHLINENKCCVQILSQK